VRTTVSKYLPSLASHQNKYHEKDNAKENKRSTRKHGASSSKFEAIAWGVSLQTSHVF
jgi:hypothetical protein